MKEFVLTQPYSSIDEMVNSGEMSVYKDELLQGNIEEYAVISRIGNRYDINGNKIDGYVKNPFIKEETKILEGTEMKYCEIEALIDKEIENAVDCVKAEFTNEISSLKLSHEEEISSLKTKHLQEISELKDRYILELAKAKEQAKEELIAKLSA